MSFASRFAEKFTPEPNSGCWLWLGASTTQGYGTYWINGSKTTAHRAAYMMQNGPIAPGHEVDHVCKNRICVNPAHLRVLTKAENLKGRRSANGEKLKCKRGHAMTDENVRIEPYGARRCRACVRELRAARIKEAK